jgi:hypothetical protein
MYAGVQRMIGTTTVLDATQIYVPLTTTDCFTETKLPAGLVAIPTTIQLAGTTLVDGSKIMLQSSAAVALSWMTTSERADYYFVNLYAVNQGLEEELPTPAAATSTPQNRSPRTARCSRRSSASSENSLCAARRFG